MNAQPNPKPIATTIAPATREWAYDDMKEDYKAGLDQWREVSYDFQHQALCVMPPIFAAGGFLVSEPYTHDRNGRAVYAGFTEVNKRYFARYSTVFEFSSHIVNLKQSLRGSTK